ncbi:MAG TPA: hypothetical protein QF753_08105 [Victivallales bacterium]|nr:hypothetical protein [Victivallales bacterium]
MKYILLKASVLSFTLAVAACSSVPKVEPQTETMVPIYVAGRNIGGNQLPNIRNGENVEVYSVGRYVDPNNDNIMYEKNVLYRVKDNASWNTRPNPSIKLPGGTNVVVPENVNPSYVKPLYAELENRVMEMKDANTQYKRKYAETIQKGTKDINRAAEKMNMVIAQNQKLIANQQKLNKQIENMQKNYDSLKTKVADQKKDSTSYISEFENIDKKQISDPAEKAFAKENNNVLKTQKGV